MPANGLGDSVTMRLVQLVDRSDDLELASPATQNYTGKMYVAGTINGDINSGVQIVVIDPKQPGDIWPSVCEYEH